MDYTGRLFLLLIIALRANSSTVSAPISRVVVKHGGEFGVNPHCTDAELAEYALKLAVGPTAAPACRPKPGQGLWPSMLPEFMRTPIANIASPLLRTDVRQHTGANVGVHFAHLYVVQSIQDWCEYPCMSPSWELAAPKPEDNSPYLLLEAAIWRQLKKVTLYHFDAAWERDARAASFKFCEGKSWGCKAYEKFRESRALFTTGPWPEAAETDPKVLSDFVQAAFIKIFDKVHELAGPDAHIGLTYSGHGGLADGSLFAGTISPEDSATVLQHATRGGRKFSMLNFAGNCDEGRWNMLAAFTPFADWILASDLKVGGFAHPDNFPNETQEVIAITHLSDVAVMKRAMENKSAPQDAVKQIIDARKHMWESQERLGMGIINNQLRQSLSAFRSDQFPTFKAALTKAFWSVPAEMRLLYSNFVQGSSCDVLVALRLLVSSGSDSGNSADSIVELIKKQSHLKQKFHVKQPVGPLELQFQALRPYYASTKSFFTWDQDTNGLAFNREHGECDFVTAFGESPLNSVPATGSLW